MGAWYSWSGMTEYETALFLHLLGVVTLASGITLAAAAHAAARRRRSPSEIAAQSTARETQPDGDPKSR